MSSTEPIQIHIPAELTGFAKPFKELLSDRDAVGVAVGGFVFAQPKEGPVRILLVQREKRDGSLAGKWEIPGGGCEERDPTVLHSLAREVYEEAGLHLTRAVRKVGDDRYFTTRSKKRVVKFSFEIAVQEIDGATEPETVPVQLSSEHQAYAWATLEEVEANKYAMTHAEQQEVIVRAFGARG